MTIGWAIVAVAILYLLDKYHVLKRLLIIAGIISIVIVIRSYDFFGWTLLQEQWQNHHAKVHQCFDPSTGKVHPANAHEPWCAADEQVQPDSTRSQDNGIGHPIPPGAVIGNPPAPPPGYTAADIVAVPNYAPPAPDGTQGNGIGHSIPPGTVIGSAPETLPADFFDHPRPAVSRNEFLFRRPGEKDYWKAICYDENTGKVSHSPKGSEGCRAGSILMEEVK